MAQWRNHAINVTRLPYITVCFHLVNKSRLAGGKVHDLEMITLSKLSNEAVHWIQQLGDELVEDLPQFSQVFGQNPGSWFHIGVLPQQFGNEYNTHQHVLSAAFCLLFHPSSTLSTFELRSGDLTLFPPAEHRIHLLRCGSKWIKMVKCWVSRWYSLV